MINHIIKIKAAQVSNCKASTEGLACPLAAHRISIEWLEVEVFICYADVAGIRHQRHDHLRCTLHVRLLSYTLKALQHIQNSSILTHK